MCRSVITTESNRLILRLMQAEDIDMLMNIWGDPDVMRYCGGAMDSDQIQHAINRSQASYQELGYAVFAVIDKAAGMLIGITGCKAEKDDPRKAELIYHFAKSAWGHGFATEAVSAYIDWFRKKDIVDSIYASIMPENASSAAVLIKSGFKQNGYVRFEDTGFIDEPFFELCLKAN